MDLHREQVRQSDMWGLEALRSLLLLNTTGLAGTIASYQLDGVQRILARALAFIGGIVAAFLAIPLAGYYTDSELNGTTQMPCGMEKLAT